MSQPKKSKFIFERDVLVQKFLNPISKLVDNVVVNLQPNLASTVCSSVDGAVVLLINLKTEIDIENTIKINLQDIKKFVRLLDCIDANSIELELADNHLKYHTKNFKFKYFLLEDGYIQKCPVNPDKINQLKFDTEFDISIQKFNEIMKGCTITNDSDKLYIYTKDNEVYAELNDFERQNINSLTYNIAESFVGERITPFALNLESIRLISGIKTDIIKIKVNNDMKISMFEITDEAISAKFIISALVK